LFEKFGNYKIQNIKLLNRKHKKLKSKNKQKILINATGFDLKSPKLPRLVSPLSNRRLQVSRMKGFGSPNARVRFWV